MSGKDKLESIKSLSSIAARVKESPALETTRQRIYDIILALLDEILRL